MRPDADRASVAQKRAARRVALDVRAGSRCGPHGAKAACGPHRGPRRNLGDPTHQIRPDWDLNGLSIAREAGGHSRHHLNREAGRGRRAS